MLFRSGSGASDLLDAYDNAEDALKANLTGKKELEDLNMVENDIRASKRPSYKLVVDHIDHVVNLVGVEHVGIGSDFDGIASTPEGLEDVSKIGILTQELVDRGYSNSDIKLILGENFLRVFSQVENLSYRTNE